MYLKWNPLYFTSVAFLYGQIISGLITQQILILIIPLLCIVVVLILYHPTTTSPIITAIHYDCT